MTHRGPDSHDRSACEGSLHALDLRATKISAEAIHPFPGARFRAGSWLFINVMDKVQGVPGEPTGKPTKGGRARTVKDGVRTVRLVKTDSIDSSVAFAHIDALGFGPEVSSKTCEGSENEDIRLHRFHRTRQVGIGNRVAITVHSAEHRVDVFLLVLEFYFSVVDAFLRQARCCVDVLTRQGGDHEFTNFLDESSAIWGDIFVVLVYARGLKNCQWRETPFVAFP